MNKLEPLYRFREIVEHQEEIYRHRVCILLKLEEPQRRIDKAETKADATYDIKHTLDKLIEKLEE